MVDQTLNCNYLFSAYLTVNEFTLFIFVFLGFFSAIYLKSFERDQLSDMVFLLVLVGGLFNTLERFSTSCVRDYLNFFDLVSFNVYDIIITVGVVILAIRQLFNYGEKGSNS